MRPGDRLHVDAALAAVDAARSVEKHDEQTPERHEVEPALGLVVMGRARLFALPAAAAAVLAGQYARLDARSRALSRYEPNVGVDEGLERMHVVQYGSDLELHRFIPSGGCEFLEEAASYSPWRPDVSSFLTALPPELGSSRQRHPSAHCPRECEAAAQQWPAGGGRVAASPRGGRYATPMGAAITNAHRSSRGA